MNITRNTMFRTLKTAAIATAAIASGSAATAHAQTLQLGPKTASVEAMADGIEARLSGNAFGWQFAIAQGGQYETSRAGGTARSEADNGGTRMAMTPNIRYEMASVAKNTTAIQTMELLRRHGLTVESSIDKFLPPEWVRGAGFNTKSVTFKHLLAHTSGLQQVYSNLNDSDAAQYGNSWDGLRFAVEKGAIPGAGAIYFNTNYALLRVLNARMWYAAGARVYSWKWVEYETVNWKGDEITQMKQVQVLLKPDETDHVRYAQDHLKREVLEPAGVYDATCSPSSSTTDGMAYKANATQQSRGWVLRWMTNQCFGATGLRLNSIEMVRYLSHLRFGSILPKDAVTEMDSVLGGWDFASSNGTFVKGGDLTWSAANVGDPDPTGAGLVQVHTCVATFPDGTAASVIVNSPLGGPDYQCVVLRKAWAAAR
jgi:CubicO group peptidase (beta-lactamase class C family)